MARRLPRRLQDANAQSIGDINDLVVAEDGSIEAVVIGVGGFLGMGEKSVAVPFDESLVDGRQHRQALCDARHHEGGTAERSGI